MEELKKLFAVKDTNGNFVLNANEVAEANGVGINAVYESRKKDYRLDKLAIFERAKKIIETGGANAMKIAGKKEEVLVALENILDAGNFEITFRKV